MKHFCSVTFSNLLNLTILGVFPANVNRSVFTVEMLTHIRWHKLGLLANRVLLHPTLCMHRSSQELLLTWKKLAQSVLLC